MSRSYIKAIKESLPDVDIVFDRFHVMKLLNKAIDDVRKFIYHSLNSKSRTSLKRSRFLILKNSSNLSPDETNRLELMLQKYESIALAYTLKEDFRAIWNIKSPLRAKKAFLQWSLDIISLTVDGSMYPELAPLHSFVFTLIEHLSGVLAYWDHNISNGRAEGINNKIKTLKRQAYGFRDNEYFKLRLYHLHRQKHRLAG